MGKAHKRWSLKQVAIAARNTRLVRRVDQEAVAALMDFDRFEGFVGPHNDMETKIDPEPREHGWSVAAAPRPARRCGTSGLGASCARPGGPLPVRVGEVEPVGTRARREHPPTPARAAA